MAEPQMNVHNALKPSDLSSTAPKSSSNTPGISPAIMTNGSKMTALNKLEYHASCNVLPLTASNDRLITTACNAVVTVDIRPNITPIIDGPPPVLIVPAVDGESMRIPMKKPDVTIAHEKRILSEGRVWRRTEEKATVMGRRRPRATW